MAIFIAEYWIVRKWFLEPLNRVMTERESEVLTAEHRYEESLAKMKEAAEEMEAKVHAARKEGAQLREGLRAEAGQARAQIIEKTRGEAEEIVTGAGEELQSDVVTAKETIVNESEKLARQAAERILGRSL